MIRRNLSLSRYTTFGLGGQARFFVHARDAAEVAEALAYAARAAVRPFLLGGGSNLLVSDARLDGFVIANCITGMSAKRGADGVVLRAGAGVAWDRLVAHAVRNGWQGVECLSGIPGTVGAAPVQNIGAYGQSLADTLQAVRTVDVHTGQERVLSADQCMFGYRTSIFQRESLLVTEVVLRLSPGGPPTLTYQDLRERFRGKDASLAEVRDAVLGIRSSKGALTMRGYPRLRSAGSFFKNPVVTMNRFRSFKDAVAESPSGKRWFWTQAGGAVKVAAGRLIESAGFARGMRSGNVGLSPHHALVLIAHRGARASEVAGLARRIQEAVLGRFGVLLEPEVTLWGFDADPLLSGRRKADIVRSQ